MTDTEKIVELKKALRIAIMCASADDPETLISILGIEEADVISAMEKAIDSITDSDTLEEYFTKVLKI